MESREPPKRGAQLGLLLDALSTKYAFGEEKYAGFVSLADSAVRDMRTASMFSIHMASKVDESRHSQADPSSYRHRGISGSGADEKNSSLLLIFMFYAAMQVSGTASFSATQLANETMTLYELDKFCRDFQIIPNMLSKTEIKAVWSTFAMSYAAKYRTALQAMTFVDFQDFFVRMALASYNKKGMKRMILAVSGFFPQPEELVRFFCAYCHLDDYSKVKHIIRTVGQETQGAINYRSAHEANARAREEQVIDLRAKAVMRQALMEAKKKEAEFKRKKAEKKRKEQAFLETLKNTQLSGDQQGSDSRESKEVHMPQVHSPKRAPTKKQLLVMHMEALEVQNSKLPKMILDMIVRNPASVHSGTAHKKGSAHTGTNAYLPHGVESPEGVLGAGFHTHGGSHDTGTMHAKDVASSVAVGLEGTAAGSVNSSSQEPTQTAPSEDEEDEEFCQSDDMMAGYHPDLTTELAKFSYNEPGFQPLEGAESGGPFLDMGNITPSSVCTITISTTNLLPEDVKIDIMVRGFDSKDDTNVRTKAKPIVPGMSRTQTVSFTTTGMVSSQVGLITIAGVSDRCNQRCEIVCPVFYRIDPSMRPRSLLTLRTLPDAKARFLGAREDLRVSFEKKLDLGGFMNVNPVKPMSRGKSRDGSSSTSSRKSESMENGRRAHSSVAPLVAGQAVRLTTADGVLL